jgi:NAD(P)H-dependent FMN reductase
MPGRKKVLAFCGSLSKKSVNLHIIKIVQRLISKNCDLVIYEDISSLPYFNPDLDMTDPPLIVKNLRLQIEEADVIMISTPEYVFSLPGSLKNLLEWTVSTTVFSNKPVGIITASGSGEKAHEAIRLIMQTLGAQLMDPCLLLISGAKGKISKDGLVTDKSTEIALTNFADALLNTVITLP